MQVGGVDLVFSGKRVIKQVIQDDVVGLSAELAFRSFLALFPFFIFLATLSGWIADLFPVQNPSRTIVDLTRDTLPQPLADVLAPELSSIINTRNLGLTGLGFVLTLLSATSGMNTAIKALDQAYDVVETRAFWKRYALAAGVTLLAGSFLIIAFLLIIVGEIVGRQAASATDQQSLFQTVTGIARWPVALALLFIAVSFIYWAAPNRDLKLSWIVPGGIAYTLGWFVATLIFSFYVNQIGNYGATYGTLAGAAILLMWFMSPRCSSSSAPRSMPWSMSRSIRNRKSAGTGAPVQAVPGCRSRCKTGKQTFPTI